MKILSPSSTQRARALLLLAGRATCGASLVAYFLGAGFCKTPWEALHLAACILAAVAKTLKAYVARGCRPLFPKWTLQFEVLRAVMRLCSGWKGDRIADVTHARIIRWQSELFGSIGGAVACRFPSSDRAVVESVRVNGLEHLWLHAAGSERADKRRKLVVLYFHGGGYAVLSPRMYISFCNSLRRAIRRELGSGPEAEDADVSVFVANYRKIPEHKFPIPAQDAVAMYDYLLTRERLDASQVILAGDSAGGGLVMSTLLRVRDRSTLPLPLAAIVLCPFVDLTGDEDELVAQHCVLSDRITRASRASLLRESPSSCLLDKATWEDASAVHCDLRGLPPVLVQAASLDYLFQHALRLAAKAEADGAAGWELDVHEGVPHVFPVFPAFVLPYASVGVDRMAAFAAAKFRARARKSGDASSEVGAVVGA